MNQTNTAQPIRVLGRYEIICHLATGGMADVWLARAKGAGGFSKLVALKTLLPAYAANSEFVEMMIREASVAAKLLHPGIVQIFDLGLIDGQYVIAMEYVPGMTLRHILHQAKKTKTQIPLAAVLNAFAEVCDALNYAHHAGLVHRDISPENIMLSELGHAKVLDFGIVADRAGPGTQIGRVKGKYAYMSPEVFSNAPAHKSRDVWALGVVLYELLCGRRPFEGASDAELLMKIVQGEITAPRTYNPSLPEEVEWTILRCLSVQTTERPSSANELAAMLRILMHEAVGRGEDDDITQLLKLGRSAEYSDLPEVSIDAEIPGSDIHISTSDIDHASVLEPSLDQRMPEDVTRALRTSQALFPPAKHIIQAQDTGNLFPAIRAKPSTPFGFDIFSAYSKKK
jgi:serine/threonine protein kinase